MKQMSTAMLAGCAALLALSGIASSTAMAQAGDFRPEAAICFNLYDAVIRERGTGFDDGDFWRFSNARQINFIDRRNTLEARSSSLDRAFAPIFPMPGSDKAGFNGLNPLRLTPPPSSATPPYGRWLALCDEAHGFTPVFSFGVPPAPQMTHRQCATNYFTLALLAPHVQEALRPRIKQAAAADAGRELPDEAIRERLSGDARKRGQSIQSGQEKPEALVAEVHACDAQYGHAPIKLQ